MRIQSKNVQNILNIINNCEHVQCERNWKLIKFNQSINQITLDSTITDHIKQMKTITEYVSYAMEWHLGHVQSGSFWSH